MTAHTPGPWLAMRGTDSTGRQVPDWAITVEKGYAWICTGPSWDDEFQEESFANAHLIAAAPELLAVALHSATALRLSGVEANAHSDNPIEWLLHQTEAAIAKAKGEQP